MKSDPRDPKTIFAKALDFEDVQARATYLDVVCADNAPLRAEVESLLASYEEIDGLLPSSEVDSAMSTDDVPVLEGPGAAIGRYTLLEAIGEGGMATVYMAEQKRPMSRRVALKIIKLGMDTKQVIGRFEAERQALAMMGSPQYCHSFGRWHD